MTIHKALHPRDDVDRQYVLRKEGRRGFVSIENSVDASIQRLEEYIEKRGGRLITASRNNTDNEVQPNGNNQKTNIGRRKTLLMF